jgi:thiol-disulfide isomerase/thioredoxin
MRSPILMLALALAAAGCGGGSSALAIGSPAPDFSLPGIDGKTHAAGEYAGSTVLALVVTCNSCPASQRAEAKLADLHRTYGPKGAAIVAVNPNNGDAMSLEDLAYTDVGESIDHMKVRAAHRRLDYAYLSDGQNQALTRQLGVTTLPHVFVFDRNRTLQYEGGLDGAGPAIDDLLAGARVRTARTAAAGCPVKPLTSPPVPDRALAAFESAPVKVEPIGAEELKRLRYNGTDKLLMVNFRATWCAPCVTEFPDLETTYRMYARRGLEFVTVSVNDPAERPAVEEFLQKHHASHPNKQFATADVYGLQAAFDPNLPAPVPLTLLLAQNGDVLYQELGASNIPRLRRAILANLKEDDRSKGMQAYWLEKPSG